METRRTMVLAVAFVLGALLTAQAVGATEIEAFSKRIGKSAAASTPDIVQRHRLACVCMSSSIPGLASSAGVLRRGNVTISGVTRVRVDCWVPAFNAAGAESGATACYDYIVLPK